MLKETSENHLVPLVSALSLKTVLFFRNCRGVSTINLDGLALYCSF